MKYCDFITNLIYGALQKLITLKIFRAHICHAVTNWQIVCHTTQTHLSCSHFKHIIFEILGSPTQSIWGGETLHVAKWIEKSWETFQLSGKKKKKKCWRDYPDAWSITEILLKSQVFEYNNKNKMESHILYYILLVTLFFWPNVCTESVQAFRFQWTTSTANL